MLTVDKEFVRMASAIVNMGSLIRTLSNVKNRVLESLTVRLKLRMNMKY
jgi:hypothetical protein